MVLFHDLWKFTIKTFQERENLSIKQGKGKNKLSFHVICLISLSVHYMCAPSLWAMKILQHQKRLPHYLEGRDLMPCIVQAKVVPRSICDGFDYPVALFCFEKCILF